MEPDAFAEQLTRRRRQLVRFSARAQIGVPNVDGGLRAPVFAILGNMGQPYNMVWGGWR